MSARAHYMAWAKQRPAAACDLATSGLVPCSIDELPGWREALSLDGNNDNGFAPLLEAIGARYGMPSASIATATGTSGANFLVCAALLEPGDDVLVETPGYDPLVAAPVLVGANVRRFERRYLDRFAVDPAAVEAALTDRTRLIILTNPHNPSGIVADEASLDEVGAIAESVGARVLVDEVYLEAVHGRTLLPAARRSDVFVSTNSLTKAYGLASLRCGWVLASAPVAEAVRRARDVVDGTGAVPAERLAVMAFQHLPRLAARARAILGPNLRAVETFVNARPELDWVRPDGGNVAFPRLAWEEDATPFAASLYEEHGVAVVPGRFFEAPAHFRLGLGVRPETLVSGLDAIGKALDERSE
jgi:aspartate/methionine/tyrosine aminotransferase